MAIEDQEGVFDCIDQLLSNTSLTLRNQSCPVIEEKKFIPLPALIDTDVSLATLYVAIMAVALFIGTFGNIMILLIAGLARGLNKIGKEFMVNLALADLCVSAIADPMCIIAQCTPTFYPCLSRTTLYADVKIYSQRTWCVSTDVGMFPTSVVKGEHFFNGAPWLCQTVASLCLTACFCAFASLTMLSLNRYIYLCHNNVYDRMYGRKTCIVMCLMCWVFAFLCEFPNFLGWGGHYFDQKSHQCIWDRTSSISYTLFVAFGLIGFPLLTMMVCFILIFRRIWNTKKALYEVDMERDGRMVKVMTETARTAKTIFVIFLVFVVCWTPYATVIAIDIEDKLNMKVHLFITLLAHLHSSANFVVYFVSNKRFRVALSRIWGCYTDLASSTTSETKSSNVRESSDSGFNKFYQCKGLKNEGSNKSSFSDDCHM